MKFHCYHGFPILITVLKIRLTNCRLLFCVTRPAPTGTLDSKKSDHWQMALSSPDCYLVISLPINFSYTANISFTGSSGTITLQPSSSPNNRFRHIWKSPFSFNVTGYLSSNPPWPTYIPDFISPNMFS